MALAVLSLVPAVTATPASAGNLPMAGHTSKLARAVAIALESRAQVVTLHDLAVNIGRANGIPANDLRSSAERLESDFAAEGQGCRAIGEPSSSPTGALATALFGYRNFATEVVTAASEEHPSIGAQFSKALGANDKAWEAALSAIGKAAHVNLLSEVPKLLYPNPGPGK